MRGRQLLLAIGPLLLLVACASAMAADPSAADPAAVPPSWNDIKMLGPIYGAFVWGAYLLGKGVKIEFVHKVELGDDDRKKIDTWVDTIAEARGRRTGRPAA